MLKKVLTTVLATWCAMAFAKSPRTLADFLTTAKEPVILAIQPDRVVATGAGTSLADFHRKKVTLGDLTAIVPEQMVVIDGSFQQPPNLYDGLDRNSKVLYLLTTLNETEWDLVTKNGIGYNDLDDAQKKVFISLLPKPFDWHSYPVDKDGMEGNKIDGGELDENELLAVKLYVHRQLRMNVNLADNQGMSDFSESNLGGEPNTTTYSRDLDTGKPDAFGVIARPSVDNELKPADLDYNSPQLKAIIKLPQKAKVRELLDLIQSATGYEMHADIRVADRSVWMTGEQARAVDVLKAIALGVTGTYRQVGSAYVLTSDLVGLGTQKLKFGIWTNDLRDEQSKLDDQWRTAISSPAHVAKMGFSPDDSAAAKGTLLADLDQSETSGQPQKWIPADQLTPGMRTLMANNAHEYRSQKWDLTSASLSSTYGYGFVLPGGKTLRPERDEIGWGFQFHPQPASALPSLPPTGSPVSLAPMAASMLAAPRSIQDAETWVKLAARKGFAEIWIQTADPVILVKAISTAHGSHISIRLAVAPWIAPRGFEPANPDLTLLGENATQVQARREESAHWQKRVFRDRDIDRDQGMANLSPTDSARQKYWAQLLLLGKTKGLSGVVLLNTAPFGYEGKRERSQREIDGTMVETQSFGFTIDQRLAFLRAKSIDPIDISNDQVMIEPDLRQPFFYDDSMMGNTSVYKGQEDPNPGMENVQSDWDTYLGGLNAKAIQGLADSFAANGLPVQIECRDSLVNIVEYFSARLISSWESGQGLPQLRMQGEVVGEMINLLSPPAKTLI